MKADRLSFREKHSDGNGIEFSIEYDNADSCVSYEGKGIITFKLGESSSFPASKLDWIIDCLLRVRKERTPDSVPPSMLPPAVMPR